MDGQPRIDTLFAFIATDTDGTEGIIAAQSALGALPLVGANLGNVDSIRGLAQRALDQAAESGQDLTVKLVHFTKRTDIETLTPTQP